MRHLSAALAALAALCLVAPLGAAAQPVSYLKNATQDDGTVVQRSQAVTAATPLPVAATFGASGATSTDASGTVTTGGAYQTVFASSTTRKGCLIQNPATATEVLSVKVGTMATPFSVPIGGSFSCTGSGGLVVTDAITLTAATTGHAFAAVSQ